MKPLDEIIEGELNRFIDAVKSKFHSEIEKGIKDVSTGIIALVTADRNSLKPNEAKGFGFSETVDVYEFRQCPFCKQFYFQQEKHTCEKGR
ncbi:hypothetical protein B1J93_17750 [Leptospira kirschneri serovar Pomona]|uniref:Uncharacterized protein n=1 Tax=Leptospira kirschneri serovar Pomona TaxID=561005 RepID=A0A1T1DH78_9LEPT|nr:hypothetical protein [Leptospira kirschneri]OOV40192.1 hypothetical protein B1J93_17750 [Leptospira kirschneri serovar Pomona]